MVGGKPARAAKPGAVKTAAGQLPPGNVRDRQGTGVTANRDYVYWNYMEDCRLTRNAKKKLPAGGRWVTIEGRHVYLKGGKVLAGPKAIKDLVAKEGIPAAVKAKVAASPKAKEEKAASRPEPKKAASDKPKEKAAGKGTALAKASTLVKDLKENKTPEKLKALADELAKLKASELHELRTIHGLGGVDPKLKSALRSDLVAHFEAKKAPETVSTQKGEGDRVPVGTFGVSKKLTWGTSDAVVQALVKVALGPKGTKEDLASVAGVPDGSKVKVTYKTSGEGSLKRERVIVEFSGEGYSGTRVLHKSSQGKHIENEEVIAKGKGPEIFGRQIENAVKHGFTHIEAVAGGSGGGVTGQRNEGAYYNGYYTWPRMGYNASVKKAELDKMPEKLRKEVETEGGQVSGLMKTKEGRDWWLGHGKEVNATFDLKPGSYSQKTLHAYLSGKGLIK